MIHYIYKIHFLCGFPTGRYYLGKRTYKGEDLGKDQYSGSGVFCKEYFTKYGKIQGVTYIKEILEINPTYKINNDREIDIIGDLWKTDPLCMNRQPGGDNFELKIRPVKQFSLDGTLVAEYSCIDDAINATGFKNIVSCCKGSKTSKTCGGYVWRYAEDSFDKYPVPSMAYAHPEHKVKINQYTLDGKFIKTWDSIREAAKAYSTASSAEDTLGDIIRGRRGNSWKKYVWKKYNGNTDDIKITVYIKKVRTVLQYDLNGNLIKRYPSVASAAKKTGIDNAGISLCARGKCKKAGGFIWKYEE